MTGLGEHAYSTEIAGKIRLVVEDHALLAWSLENGQPPGAAQLEALRKGIIPLRYSKNLTALTIEEQERLCSSSVLVCGCGGLGGILMQLLARAGVGSLRIVDGDTFAPSNLNRQLLSDTRGLSRPKVQVAAETLQAVNPLVEVDAIRQTLGEANAELLVRGVDLVVDALDNIESRLYLAAAARHLMVPFIHGAVAGWWGQVSTFLPTSLHDLTNIYGAKRSRDPAEQELGVLGPAAAIIGSLQALEAVRILCGRLPVYSELLLYFDGESGRMEMIPLSDEP
jgi:molybdopterin/thiamine biosynthesis adenylyltransferase